MRVCLAVLAVLGCCDALGEAVVEAPCANGKGITPLNGEHQGACCPKSCGSCGGKGCGGRPGGESQCCGAPIFKKNVTCGTPPCVLMSPVIPCKTGLVNSDKSVCCSGKCDKLCGQKGCSGAPGGEKGCCASAIQASGKLCSKNFAALPSSTEGCILRATSTPTTKPTTKPTSKPTSKPTTAPPGDSTGDCTFPNATFEPGVGCIDGTRTCSDGLYPFTEYWNRGDVNRAEFCADKSDFKRCTDINQILHETSGGFSCIAKSAKCAKSGIVCASFPLDDQTCVNEQCKCDNPKFVLTGTSCEEKCGVNKDGLPFVCLSEQGDYKITDCVNGACKCADTRKTPKSCPARKDDNGGITFIPQSCSGGCPGP